MPPSKYTGSRLGMSMFLLFMFDKQVRNIVGQKGPSTIFILVTAVYTVETGSKTMSPQLWISLDS